jgi:O-methyltransferase
MNLEEIKAELLGDWTAPIVFGKPLGGEERSSANTTALTLIGPELLDELRDLIEKSIDLPGDFVETGVWRGGACIWAAAVLESLGSDKRVYVCDSFEGLPPVTHPKETIDYSEAVSLIVPLEEVEANFDRFGLKHKAVFVKGWFKDTMPSLNIPVSVLRLDGDMYESTNDVLKYMYDRVSPGGYVIIDDYCLPPCARAVDEFRSKRKLRGGLKNRAGVWWQKPPVFR